MIKSQINSAYDTQELRDFVGNIDERFEREGELIFKNKRNEIKSFVLPETGEVVVKRFGNKNIFQRLSYSMRGTSKARKAFDNGTVLIECGVETPIPIAYAEKWSCKMIGHCYYVTTRTDARPIEELFHGEIEPSLAKAYAELIFKMHTHGIVHHDMNRFNVLYTKDSDRYHLSVIDINRMRKRADGKEADYDEYIDDFVRLTDRIDFYVDMAREYAKLRGIDEANFIFEATTSKITHNLRWVFKKRGIIAFCKKLNKA